MLSGGETVAETPLEFTGEVSTYAAKISAPQPGEYTLLVMATDPSNANMGRHLRDLKVGP